MSNNSWQSATPYVTGAIGALLGGPLGGAIGMILGKGMTAVAADNSSYDAGHHSDHETSFVTSDFPSHSDLQDFTDYFNF